MKEIIYHLEIEFVRSSAIRMVISRPLTENYIITINDKDAAKEIIVGGGKANENIITTDKDICQGTKDFNEFDIEVSEEDRKAIKDLSF